MKINRFVWWSIFIKNFVPHCPEALRYAKVWGRDVVRGLTLAYAKRLFPDSNPCPQWFSYYMPYIYKIINQTKQQEMKEQ